MNSNRSKNMNGLAKAVALIKALEPKHRYQLLKKIAKSSPLLFHIFDQCQFLYSEIYKFDNKSLEALIRDVPTEEWLIAWKLTKNQLRSRILDNMSETMKNDFINNTKTTPRLRKSQVYKVQIAIARQAEEGLMAGKYKLSHATHLKT